MFRIHQTKLVYNNCPEQIVTHTTFTHRVMAARNSFITRTAHNMSALMYYININDAHMVVSICGQPGEEPSPLGVGSLCPSCGGLAIATSLIPQHMAGAGLAGGLCLVCGRIAAVGVTVAFPAARWATQKCNVANLAARVRAIVVAACFQALRTYSSANVDASVRSPFSNGGGAVAARVPSCTSAGVFGGGVEYHMC